MGDGLSVRALEAGSAGIGLSRMLASGFDSLATSAWPGCPQGPELGLVRTSSFPACHSLPGFLEEGRSLVSQATEERQA